MVFWQQRTLEFISRKEEEFIVYFVIVRMLVWEEMLFSNKVFYIKKVDFGSVFLGKKFLVKVFVFGSVKKFISVKVIGQILENKVVILIKVVKDYLMQKVDYIKVLMDSLYQIGGNLGKIGSVIKMMQQKLFEQVIYGKIVDVVEKLRRERMEEVQKIQYRYDNGILKEGRLEKVMFYRE